MEFPLTAVAGTVAGEKVLFVCTRYTSKRKYKLSLGNVLQLKLLNASQNETLASLAASSVCTNRQPSGISLQ